MSKDLLKTLEENLSKLEGQLNNEVHPFEIKRINAKINFHKAAIKIQTKRQKL